MKKTRLIIEYDYDFSLFGVISNAKSYKLAWDLNQSFHVNLVRQPDLPVEVKSNQHLNFSYFSTPPGLNKLQIFRNKPQEAESGKYFLIPEFPHYDFIILAAMNELYSSEDLIEKIKQLPSVQMAATIPLEGLKSKVNFLL